MSRKSGTSAARGLVVSLESPASLVTDPTNPRTMSEEAFQRLKAGVAAFGLVDAIIARRADRLVLGGHQRLRAAMELRFETVPVVFLDDLDDQHARALSLLLNNPDAQGRWNVEQLTTLLEDLPRSLREVAGFDADTLADLLTPPKPAPLPRTAYPPPTYAWVLVGIDVGQYGEIAETIEALSRRPDTVVRTTVGTPDGDGPRA